MLEYPQTTGMVYGDKFLVNNISSHLKT